jgi:hydroxyethylthiazole kinase-like sugar kinase family protein
MAFKLVSGRAVTMKFPVPASQAFINGALAYADGSGALIPADATSGDHFGIIQKTIATTDSDYAVAKTANFIIPQDDNVFRVDVGTGTLTTAMIGNRYDLKDSVSIDVTAQSKKVVTVVGFISATKALVKINAVVTNSDVVTS